MKKAALESWPHKQMSRLSSLDGVPCANSSWWWASSSSACQNFRLTCQVAKAGWVSSSEAVTTAKMLLAPTILLHSLTCLLMFVGHQKNGYHLLDRRCCGRPASTASPAPVCTASRTSQRKSLPKSASMLCNQPFLCRIVPHMHLLGSILGRREAPGWPGNIWKSHIAWCRMFVLNKTHVTVPGRVLGCLCKSFVGKTSVAARCNWHRCVRASLWRRRTWGKVFLSVFKIRILQFQLY